MTSLPEKSSEKVSFKGDMKNKANKGDSKLASSVDVKVQLRTPKMHTLVVDLLDPLDAESNQHNILHQCLCLLRDVAPSFKLKHVCFISQLQGLQVMGINDTSLPSLPLLVHLKPPPLGKFKLKTNGYRRGNPVPSTGATILRNNQGCMIFAACRYFSHSSSLVTELKVIIFGLQQCLTQSYTFINVDGCFNSCGETYLI